MDAEIIVNLYKLIINPDVNSEILINYIIKYKININTYLPSFNGSEMPLIYYCTLRPDLEDLFKYLIKNNVDLYSRINAENPIDLITYSDIKYIKYLSSRGCKISENRIYGDLYNILLNGNVKKFLTFIKYGIINKEHVMNIINRENILFDILDKMYEKLFNICKHINTNVIDTINELCTYYIDTFKFFFNNGISPNIKKVKNITDDNGEIINTFNISFAQNILNTYLYDLIKLLIEYKVDFSTLKFYHYSNFSLSNKQVMTPIYNNENFEKINSILSNHIRPKKFRRIK